MGVEILGSTPLPMRAPGVIGQIYRQVVSMHANHAIPRYWEVGKSPNNYTERRALQGLQESGMQAGVELTREECSGTRVMAVRLLCLWHDDGVLTGNLRTIVGGEELAPRPGKSILQQWIEVDPLQPGLDVLKYSPKLVELAHWMEGRALELSAGFPDYFKPLADITVA